MRLTIFGKEIIFPKWIKYVFSIITFAALIALGFYFEKKASAQKGTFEEIISSASVSPTLCDATENPSHAFSAGEDPTPAFAEIRVYISGQIKNPDVYTIPSNSLIVDLIAAAGGVTTYADLEFINLAYPLRDNMMIRIPSKDDTDKSWLIDDRNTPTSKPSTPNGGVESSADTKININTANIATLCTIPGIGESTAQKIISYRTENGPFKTIQDITKVSGIKESRFEKIKDYITV